jgi:hypothetical protein
MSLEEINAKRVDPLRATYKLSSVVHHKGPHAYSGDLSTNTICVHIFF